jgi:hypothetical protein
MTTVKEIASAVAHLPLQELARFRAWFDEFDAQGWDKQIEEDVQAGKLDELADHAIKDHQAGRCTEL